jgi:hypothetical protein
VQTIAAYQTLYESSVAFGLRKALQTEYGKAQMELRVQQVIDHLSNPFFHGRIHMFSLANHSRNESTQQMF